MTSIHDMIIDRDEIAVVTAAQHENAKAALAFFEALPDNQLVPKLATYSDAYELPTCYCLAGWLPHIPHFKAQGMTACNIHAPEMEKQYATSESVFGVEDMYCSMSEDTSRTEKEEVLLRLRTLINQSQVME